MQKIAIMLTFVISYLVHEFELQFFVVYYFCTCNNILTDCKLQLLYVKDSHSANICVCNELYYLACCYNLQSDNHFRDCMPLQLCTACKCHIVSYINLPVIKQPSQICLPRLQGQQWCCCCSIGVEVEIVL